MEAPDSESEEEEGYDAAAIFDLHDNDFDDMSKEINPEHGLSKIEEEEEDLFSESSIKNSSLRQSIYWIRNENIENDS